MASTDGQIFRIEFTPGIHRQSTRYAQEGGWYDADKVRFRDHRPENMKGWQRESQTQFLGKARKLITWADNAGNAWAAFGTNSHLYSYGGGLMTDITPIIASIHETGGLNTTLNNPLIYVNFAAHGGTAGDYVLFSNMVATVANNVYLNGQYTVNSVTNANLFEINYGTSAGATATSVGVFDAQMLLPVGASSAGFATGYGTGTYGTGTYGTGTGAAPVPLRTWSLDHFGQLLVANPRGGRIYTWNPVSAADRAVLIPTSPTVNNVIIVSPEDRHLISMGTTDPVTSIFDPRNVVWSDTEDYTSWVPTASNTAGSQPIGVGSRIVGAVRGRQQILFWTDISLHSMTFVGPPFTFNFQQLGDSCGLIGPNAAVTFGGATYWMSDHNFYVYDGTLRDMDCSVLRYVFDNINSMQYDKIYAGSNTEFSELIWLYCSKSSNEIDSYVIYDILDNAWSIGTFSWTTWQDQGIFPTVLANQWTDYRLYDVDVSGVYTADGSPMTSYVSSADFDIGDGDTLIYIDRIIPDFEFVGGNLNIVEITAQFKKYPASQLSSVKGPFTVSAGTSKISMRGRGRQAAIRIAVSNGVSGWRLGALRFNIQPDGKR